jgi:hypothetical protein
METPAGSLGGPADAGSGRQTLSVRRSVAPVDWTGGDARPTVVRVKVGTVER